ncbi:MAG TPA: hypothetical protein VL333_06595 [Candidatus Saccharimonadales bacterium]|nr:hypothetical protein [Candidatus Saccharimonadales bacterium]
MYTSAERDELRRELLALAEGDPRITGGAITGSASVDREDAWSDIDLAFGVRDADELPAVLQDLTAHMYAHHGAVEQLDVVRAPWIYRVFILPSTLQVDLAFAPADAFGARAPTFRLVFGVAQEPRHIGAPVVEELIGYAWLYAIHARSSIARNKVWQAEYMISNVRDHVLGIACRRLGLPSVEGRGMDALPAEVADPLRDAIVRSLEPAELTRAMAAVVDALLREIAAHDPTLAARLHDVLLDLVATAHPGRHPGDATRPGA